VSRRGEAFFKRHRMVSIRLKIGCSLDGIGISAATEGAAC
jgi:hypothetical protein